MYVCENADPFWVHLGFVSGVRIRCYQYLLGLREFLPFCSGADMEFYSPEMVKLESACLVDLPVQYLICL